MEIILHPDFEPDYTHVISAASNQWVPRIPLYDHNVGPKVMKDIMGVAPQSMMFSSDNATSQEGFRQFWNFWRTMGYDTASMEFGIRAMLEGGGALDGRSEGCIKDREDFEKYPWDGVYDRYFNRYTRLFENMRATCPPGMKAIGGAGNGVFEAVQDLVGYMNLCYIRMDDEELYADLFKKMGEIHYSIWERIIREYSDLFCVFRFGDDLGFKSATLLDPDDIRELIIPCYKKIIDRVHAAGKPFLLHSCGCIFDVMDDLINVAGINAKHSNEDQIAHFSVWVEKYGDRIGNFGGVDTDVLCRFDKDYVHNYVLDCLEKIKGHGGIAFGSGNSIPDYVDTECYVEMNNTVREWRGDFSGK